MSGELLVENVRIVYGRQPAIDGVDLPPLRPGELVALAGPNGAGKTTLMKAIGGLAHHEGQVTLAGRPLSALGARERAALVGYMPQVLPATVSLTVLESVILTLDGAPRRQEAPADVRAAALLERLGLAGIALKPLRALSGGERQMAAFAQAVACDPPLLLLDEPVSALDPARQFLVMAMARRAAAEGRIVLVVLHDLALACQWADRIILLREGRLHACASPDRAVTPQALRAVYGVDARVERCSRGRVQIMVDGISATRTSWTMSGGPDPDIDGTLDVEAGGTVV
jgi:iron complex transport system ATP-binding protein